MLLSRDGEGGVEATFIQTLKTVVRIEKNNKMQDMFVTVYVVDKPSFIHLFISSE